MGSDAYIEYINSEKWANKRAHKLLLSKQHCEACKATPQSFHVHHLTYANLFNELMSDLMVLCERCHKRAEALIATGKLSRTGNTVKLRELTRTLIREPSRSVYVPNAGAIADRNRREQERLANIKRFQQKARGNRKFKQVLTPQELKERDMDQKYFAQKRYDGGHIPRLRY